jgi:hypothetical protein
MKIQHWIPACAVATSLLSSTASFSQVTEDGMGKILPVELYVCQFMDGKGHSDLEPVVAQWNAFMDEHDVNGYAAWLLTPYYRGAEQNFDVLWMGAATDGNAMGRGAHHWITEGGEVAAAFAEVMDCPVHLGLASAMYKAPPKGNTSGLQVISMSDCKMNEGTRYSDVRSAEVEWAQHLSDAGSDAAYYHWFPDFGGGDQDFDYKLVYGYTDLKRMGSNWEMMANGGGRTTSREIFGDLDECDDSRVYVGKSIRSTKLRK